VGLRRRRTSEDKDLRGEVAPKQAAAKQSCLIIEARQKASELHLALSCKGNVTAWSLGGSMARGYMYVKQGKLRVQTAAAGLDRPARPGWNTAHAEGVRQQRHTG